MSAEEKSCEQHFASTIKRSTEGRFVVKLPFRQPVVTIGDSFITAQRRFKYLERKLAKDEDLKSQYCRFMHEYEDLGHMTKIGCIADTNSLPKSTYFLPHHCVLKADSSTTKLRVVFDASAKTSSNFSLNDALMVGPTIQSDLFSVITRFRLYKYVFTADISKMYRQIEVDPSDRKFQMILWRDDPSKSLGVYHLNTVTYGTSCAPYLATRCLTKLAEDSATQYPAAATAILKETYVDDIMTGAYTLEAASQLLADIQNMLSSARFELRKYCSNNTELLHLIPEAHKEPFLQIGKHEVVKTLGLIWQPSSDVFVYNFSFNPSTIITKRSVFSELGKIFDPLGLISPVVAVGKIFMQRLWKDNISWDEPLPDNYATYWKNYTQQLLVLNSYQLPRYLLSTKVMKSIQIHSFSDSSELAYGACCYLRCIDVDDNISTKLVCGKSRVAPTKSLSIPKLELLAATIVVELVEKLLDIMQVCVKERFYYTDSKIVLAWIAKPSYTWTTFVANRIAKIQELTRAEEWYYVNTKHNPADLISRGSLPEDFLKASMWQQGPEFLHSQLLTIESTPGDIELGTIPEKRPSRLALLATKPTYTDLTFSTQHRGSLHRLERIFANCIRFYSNARLAIKDRQIGDLTLKELEAARLKLILNAQLCYLSEEYNHIARQHPEKAKRIKGLSPLIDENQLMRVGGRLHHSSLPYCSKHQIILPKNSQLTKILVFSYHFMYMHAGATTLHSIIRQQYWPINGLNICRNTVHKCIRCFRTKPSKGDQLMGSLPKERITPGRAFLTTGIDFCGPVPIHSKIRGRAPIKAYIAIFVCFTTKAVHIETVSDLSTAAFIAALRRFIARRGLCQTIMTDNATNFIGAKNELAELHARFHSQNHQSQIFKLCQENRIEWRTIPPRSPHFGGLWEAAVKQAKHHLVRVVANATLNFEELSTITAQIEAILNSRPLTPLSSDPSDLQALTPGHFLIGQPLASFAEPDISDINYNRLQHFRRLQQLQQSFWKRWSHDYLHLLQQRYKWSSKGEPLKEGTLVLVKDDNLPPYKWPLGRIVSTSPGHDGVHRVANVKTSQGIYERAVAKLYPLPIDD